MNILQLTINAVEADSCWSACVCSRVHVCLPFQHALLQAESHACVLLLHVLKSKSTLAQWGLYSGPTTCRCGSAEDTAGHLRCPPLQRECTLLDLSNNNNIAETTAQFWINYVWRHESPHVLNKKLFVTGVKLTDVVLVSAECCHATDLTSHEAFLKYIVI